LKRLLIILLLLSFESSACLNGVERPISFSDRMVNLSVSLVVNGYNRTGVAVLLLLNEFQSTERYEIASNLGTAYELSGNNKLARKWIEKAIILNKDSHFGTEWLHLAILDAKLKMEKNPDWLKTHSIIDLGSVDKHKAYDAFYAQLHERVRFVKPKDDIVADMFYLAGITMLDGYCCMDIDGEILYGTKAFNQSLKYSDLRKKEIQELLKSH